MARDYENLHDIDELDDTELRDLIREQLSQQTSLDVNDIIVRVADGAINLSGRVGTDGERRIAEHVLTDVLGIQEFTNELIVDSIRRAESPEAIEDHLADEELRSGSLLGDVAAPYSAESEHLAAEEDEDLAGTADYQKVMEDGMTWNPPSSPTPEGMDSSVGELGENH